MITRKATTMKTTPQTIARKTIYEDYGETFNAMYEWATQQNNETLAAKFTELDNATRDYGAVIKNYNDWFAMVEKAVANNTAISATLLTAIATAETNYVKTRTAMHQHEAVIEVMNNRGLFAIEE